MRFWIMPFAMATAIVGLNADLRSGGAIESLELLSEEKVSKDKIFQALNPHQIASVISGNFPNAVTSGNFPNAVTSGNFPSAVTSGNFPGGGGGGGVISGNFPGSVTSGNFPSAVTSGNFPSAVTSGNFPSFYKSAQGVGDIAYLPRPMTKLNI